MRIHQIASLDLNDIIRMLHNVAFFRRRQPSLCIASRRWGQMSSETIMVGAIQFSIKNIVHISIWQNVNNVQDATNFEINRGK